MMNETSSTPFLADGALRHGMRNYNERLILSVLQRDGVMPGSEIAKRTGLSAQTISVILRKLDADGLIIRGKPVGGKIGKPSVPIALDPGGALSMGFKLGRRSTEVVLMDLGGNVHYEDRLQYPVALPADVFAFIEQSLEAATRELSDVQVARLCGIGIAAPFEIWKWADAGDAIPSDFLSWKDIAFREEMKRFTDLPVVMLNDATSACWAEHVMGRGKEFRDYAYFFVSAFIGGGIVLDGAVYEGRAGNAGAMGALLVGDENGQVTQLLHRASIWGLEQRLEASGLDPHALWTQPQDWSPFASQTDDWLEETADGLAQACVSVCAVIDFEAVIIDGFLPGEVRARLVDQVRARLEAQDMRGLLKPRIEEGSVGDGARALGAACTPILKQYFLTG